MRLRRKNKPCGVRVKVPKTASYQRKTGRECCELFRFGCILRSVCALLMLCSESFGKDAQRCKVFALIYTKIVDTRGRNCYSKGVSLYIYLCLVFCQALIHNMLISLFFLRMMQVGKRSSLGATAVQKCSPTRVRRRASRSRCKAKNFAAHGAVAGGQAGEGAAAVFRWRQRRSFS